MKWKEILTNLTINKCTLNSIITHHNTNTQNMLNNYAYRALYNNTTDERATPCAYLC